MSTPREDLAEALRKARLDAGYRSQADLATAMHLTRSVITKGESASQPVPSPGTLISWAEVTGATLADIQELAARCLTSTPQWFVAYLSAESGATVIRVWSPLLVPGILQTEAYAHEVLSVQSYPAERLAELVRERMRRQGVLDRAQLVVVLDVSVLARMMGSAEVMAEQLGRLVDLAQRPNITVHIVPENTNHGAWGELNIASRGSSATVNYSTAIDDIPSTAPEQIDKSMTAFERIMGHAASAADSLDSLRHWRDTWEQQI